MKVPEADIFQKVVRWIIIIFFGYALLHNALGLRKPFVPPPSSPQAAEKSKDSNCRSTLDDYPLLRVDLFPAYTPSVRTRDTKAGTDEPAACGQKVTYSYEYTVREKSLQDGKKSITIGGGEVPRGVELGLIGMKPGGERELTIPPDLAFIAHGDGKLPPEAKNQILGATVSLKTASPSLPTSAFPLREIDNHIGKGKQVMCGDEVTTEITAWKVDGTKVFSTDGKPVTFVIGKSTMPYGIEEGTIGMKDNGGRLIVLPPAYTRKLIAGDDSSQALPKETIMVQLDHLHITPLPAKEVPVSPEPSVPTQKPAAKPEKPAPQVKKPAAPADADGEQ